jgi:hypothetical protein
VFHELLRERDIEGFSVVLMMMFFYVDVSWHSSVPLIIENSNSFLHAKLELHLQHKVFVDTRINQICTLLTCCEPLIATPSPLQANLVVLPRSYADDFRRFCELNSRACPLLEILDNGPYTVKMAAAADIRTDLPKYRVGAAEILLLQ